MVFGAFNGNALFVFFSSTADAAPIWRIKLHDRIICFQLRLYEREYMHVRCVVSLHIDVRSSTIPSIKVYGRVIRVLTKQVPGSEDTCCHVLIDSKSRDSVDDRNGQYIRQYVTLKLARC